MLRKPFKDISFRTKLMLSYIVVIILCISVFGTTVFISFSNRFEQEITTNTDQVTNLAADNMTDKMESIERILSTVQANSAISKILTNGRELSVYEEIAAIESELNTIDPLQAVVSSLNFYVANRDDYPQSFDSTVTSTALVQNEVWYNRTIEKNGGLYWDIMDTSNSNGVLCVSRAFIDTRTHEILGVIRADINLSLFTKNSK